VVADPQAREGLVTTLLLRFIHRSLLSTIDGKPRVSRLFYGIVVVLSMSIE
jgi:hypothetical protein